MVVDRAPCSNGKVVAFFIGNQTLVVLFRNQGSLGVTFGNEFRDFVEVDIVILTSRNGSNGSEAESQAFHAVGSLCGFFSPVGVEDFRKDFLQLFLALDIVVVREVSGQNFVEEYAAQRCFADFTLGENTNWALQL